MNKYFNIAGPCHPDKHYMLSAEEKTVHVVGTVSCIPIYGLLLTPSLLNLRLI